MLGAIRDLDFYFVFFSGSRILEFYNHSFLVGKIPFRDDRAPLLKKHLAETELFAISGTKILKLFASAKVVLGCRHCDRALSKVILSFVLVNK